MNRALSHEPRHGCTHDSDAAEGRGRVGLEPLESLCEPPVPLRFDGSDEFGGSGRPGRPYFPNRPVEEREDLAHLLLQRGEG